MSFEAGGIFEALFEGLLLGGFHALVGVGRIRFTFQPRALLMGIQEPA